MVTDGFGVMVGDGVEGGVGSIPRTEIIFGSEIRVSL